MEIETVATDDRPSGTQEAAEDDTLINNSIRIYLRVRPVQDPTELLELSTEDGRATFNNLKPSG